MNFSKKRPVKIVMLGAGGTGAHIAPHLYRLLYALERPVKFIICDGDKVEPKNLVRQNFTEADLGENKARVIAERYSDVFGLETSYIPRFIEDAGQLEELLKLVNWRVRNALGKILETGQSIPNLRVRLMNWNMTFKGVDDFYKARNEAASKGVNILDMTSNFITMRLESLWKQEYPEQDRGFIHTCEWEELTVPIDQLTAGKPADMKKAQYYLKLLWAGKVDFPPLVSVNGVVIDGLHRFWAYQQMGYQTVTVYQNKPWAMPTAA